jgi:hypothetical protein
LGSNHQSPSITVTVATFTVTTWQFTHNNTTSDLTSNLSFPPDGLPYTISFVSSTISPSYATYTPTGNPSQSALNNGDIAQLILAGTGNFVGSDPQSPSISILVENRLTVSNDFVLGSTYSVGYLDSGMAPSLSIQVGGYTYYRFFPTTIGSVTPTTPFNIRSLVVGGGGSGGMGNSQNYESGDGGNAGTLIDSSGSFTINSSIPLTVGGPGVASSFSTVTANGGATGGIVNISGGNGGSGAGGPGGGAGGSGVYYAGGGGGCGGHNQHSGGSGGSGGSGVGGQGQSMTSGGAPYSNGANGFGGGGGGTHGPATTVGGSGVVILRFPSYTT